MTKAKPQSTQSPKRSAIRKKFSGVVVSEAQDKTIVVKVDRIAIHPKYHKRYYLSKKYQVHDEQNQFKKGDQVEFAECRPYSKKKKWKVISNKQ